MARRLTEDRCNSGTIFRVTPAGNSYPFFAQTKSIPAAASWSATMSALRYDRSGGSLDLGRSSKVTTAGAITNFARARWK